MDRISALAICVGCAARAPEGVEMDLSTTLDTLGAGSGEGSRALTIELTRSMNPSCKVEAGEVRAGSIRLAWRPV